MSDERALTPEKPSTPKPSKKNPRHASVDTTETEPPDRNIAIEELRLKLSTEKERVVKEHQEQLEDVSDEALKELSDTERASRLKANEDVSMRLDQQLAAQAALYNAAARVLEQSSVTVEQALSQADAMMTEEQQIPDERDVNSSDPCQSISTYPSHDEEVEQYARNLESTDFLDYDNALVIAKREVPIAREVRMRKRHSSNAEMIDMLVMRDGDDEESDNCFDRETHFDEDGELVEKVNMIASKNEDISSSDSSKEIISRDRDIIGQEELRNDGDSLAPQVTSSSSNSKNNRNRKFTTVVDKVIAANRAKKLAFKSLGAAAAARKVDNVGSTTVVESDEIEKTEEEKEDELHELPLGKSPKIRNRKFSSIVDKVIADNRATKLAFKSLGAAAATKTVREVLPTPQVESDEIETRGEKLDELRELPLGKSPKIRNRKFTTIVDKVIADNRAKKLAFKSLGAAAASIKVGDNSVSSAQMEIDEIEKKISKEEQKVDELHALPSGKSPKIRNKKFTNVVGKVISANRAKRQAFKSLGEAAGTKNKITEDKGDDLGGRQYSYNLHDQKAMDDLEQSSKSDFGDLYKNAILSAESSIRDSVAKDRKSQRKLLKKESMQQADILKISESQAEASNYRALGAIEKLNRENSIQDDIFQSEISLEATASHFTISAALVVDNLTKLSKYERAVQRIQEESMKIKMREKETDEELRHILMEEDENNLKLSEKHKDAYYAEWCDVQAEMASVREQMATQTKDEMSEHLDKSDFFCELHSQGIQDQIEMEVKNAMMREELRAKRAQQRLDLLEEIHGTKTM